MPFDIGISAMETSLSGFVSTLLSSDYFFSYEFYRCFLIRTDRRTGNDLRDTDFLQCLYFYLAVCRGSAYRECIDHLVCDKGVQSSKVTFGYGLSDRFLCAHFNGVSFKNRIWRSCHDESDDYLGCTFRLLGILMDGEAGICTNIHAPGVSASCFCTSGYLFDRKFKVLWMGGVDQNTVCYLTRKLKHLWSLSTQVYRDVPCLECQLCTADLDPFPLLRDLFPRKE